MIRVKRLNQFQATLFHMNPSLQHNCIKDVCVLVDVISSDHRPLSFAVCGSVCSHKLDEVDETQCARRK